tara:strand:+ start:143 stop:385 length:243 start_codon:yes stop_codon:yes gene_type:complete
MITYFIYALIFIILVYVLYLAVKAIGRGIDAKQNLDKDESNFKELNDQNIVQELDKLKNLYKEGAINDDEFKKAKDKLLK